ncbi:LuxR C-terminal-related transcriptional regulator [Saccharospirillum impatiens]|uniref:LuxR C-terminal-related transcriptional regulator n=1 Tax=Saccharospirillum impatiens TaxID=169438 RepID=UPI000400A3A0|nr:LuxR C-terminal-related transcriptional regulator [Saccharospirillum impatiens]
MTTTILATKLYAPPTNARSVRRPRLIERLNAGANSRLTLVSAPAGFGKTTLVSDWTAVCEHSVAWLSLDENDVSLPRFLSYMMAALRQLSVEFGDGVLAAFQAPQPPPLEVILTALINDLQRHKTPFTLVLDDYHRVDSSAVDEALVFLLDHAPEQCHLVIATREDPALPLARWRARGQLTELRAADLRFTQKEAVAFLTQAMGLNLPDKDIAVLEQRTEGWAAGLQLAALFLQREPEQKDRVTAFSGRHHFVLDYLLKEVLNDQPDDVLQFLLHTAVLDRFCAPLCDTVLATAPGTSRVLLDRIERANLFLVPLDNERYWYRYHHLFSDLLRQRLQQSELEALHLRPAELHRRASHWFEQQGWHLEAFQQALAAGDIDLAARRVEGDTLPLHLRGEVMPVLNWLMTLAEPEKRARPGLWIMQASALMMIGQLESIEPCLQSVEQALKGTDLDEYQRNLLGHAHAIRAFLAVSQHRVDDLQHHSREALTMLHPENLAVRTAANWTLGFARQLSGDRAAAHQAYTDALAISQAIGHQLITFLSTLGLASLKAANNELVEAACFYQKLLQKAPDPLWPIYCEVHLNLAHLHYQWNELEAADDHARKARVLASQFAYLDRTLACDILLAKLVAARGDVPGAIARLRRVREIALQHAHNAVMPELVTELNRLLIQTGDCNAAADVLQGHDLPLAEARLAISLRNTSAALTLLDQAYERALTNEWADEQLKLRLMQALAFEAAGQPDKAAARLRDALVLGEPGNHQQLFLDEGLTMARVLASVCRSGTESNYLMRLLEAFGPVSPTRKLSPVQTLIEPLSHRERAVLSLIAEGYSNQAISERLFLALSTVKGHNRRIFDKLGVQRRTEAVARAKAFGLLP